METLGKELHHLSETVEYRLWMEMKARCDPASIRAHPRYSGRGITVCDRWANSFTAFLADMGGRPEGSYSIDRRDNDGNYEPQNCRWATPREQANNRHTTIWLTDGAETDTLANWCRRLGVPRLRAWRRHRNGETFQQIFRGKRASLINPS